MEMKFRTKIQESYKLLKERFWNKIHLFSTKTPTLSGSIHQVLYSWEVSHEDVLSLNENTFR